MCECTVLYIHCTECTCECRLFVYVYICTCIHVLDAHTSYGLGRGSQRLSAEGSKDEVKWLKDIRYQTHVEQED